MSTKKFPADNEVQGFDQIEAALNVGLNPTSVTKDELIKKLMSELNVERKARVNAEQKAEKERSKKKKYKRLCQEYQRQLIDSNNDNYNYPDISNNVSVNVDVDTSQTEVHQPSKPVRHYDNTSLIGKNANGDPTVNMDWAKALGAIGSLFNL